MLEINGLSAFYGSIRALDNVSVRVPSGAIVSIVGANGAGKSTLLKSICGAIAQKKGEIIFEGEPIHRASMQDIVRMGVSLVPEGRQLFTSMTVLDNLHLGAYTYFSRKNRARFEENLEQVFALFPRLHERRPQVAGTMSGGEQQMLSIGRALMAGPRLLMLDEPSLGLAPMIIEEIFDNIRDLNRRGTTVLLVEQNAREALRLSDYAYVLETGKVVHKGAGPELLQDPAIEKAYLGGL